MRRAFNLEKYTDLQSGEIAVHLGYVQRVVVAEALKLNLLLETVTGDILLHGRDHCFDGGRDVLRGAILGEAENRVAHE